MFIVIKSEHYDCTNLICKKDTLEEAVAAVKDSMAQRINKNYHAGLTGTDITHENEDHYGFSFTFDENRHADSSEPRAYSTYDYWNGDDQESVEWVVYEVTTDKPFFLLSYEEYESIELTGFYDTFDEAFEEMKELIAESVNDVFDEDATADDVEDMEDYNVFVHSNKDSQDNGAPLAFASFCDDYPNREWTVFHVKYDKSMIVSKDETTVNRIADMLDSMGFDAVTGYFDPEEDKRSGEVDSLTGYYYVDI